jgi:hypothetical protein
MYRKEIPFIIPLKRQATSTNDFTAKTEPWRAGDTIIIDGVSVCNESSNNKDASIGVTRGDFTVYLETLELDFKTFFYSTKNQIMIPSEYRVVIKFINPASSDIFYVNIFGRIIPCDTK